MPVTIDPATKVVTVTKDFLVPLGGTLYSLNTETFRATMNALLDDEEYIWMPDWATRNAPVTVAGVTLAQTIEMINGYSLTFDDSSGTDAYSVRLDGSNNNLFDIQNGILNQNLVQVIPTNSAGLTYSKEVEDQSFTDSRVWIDTNSPYTGNTFPVGTPGYPVNNATDATAIIIARNLPQRVHLVGDVVQGIGESMAGYDIVGEGHTTSSITLQGGDTSGSKIAGCLVTGQANGPMYLTALSELEDCSGFSGECYSTELGGTITLSNASVHHEFVDCHSGVAGPATPIIDGNDIVDLNLAFRRYAGGVELRNISDAGSEISVDLTSGHLVLDSTCTAGICVVRGTGWLTDNSSGMTIITTGLTTDPDAVVVPPTPAEISTAVWDEAVSGQTDPSTMGGWITKKLLTVSKFLGLK